MQDIIEIPVFVDSPVWQERILTLTGSEELVNYQGFKQLGWQADGRIEVYFYLIDHFNEHMIHESLGAIIPRAPMTFFCCEEEPGAQSTIMEMFSAYQKYFSTPAAWLVRNLTEEAGERTEMFPILLETGIPVHTLEQDTPESLKQILRLALKETYNTLLQEQIKETT